MASVKANRSLAVPELEPTDIYGSDGPIRLRIATGGAGQSGLLGALARAFIEDRISKTNCSPFRVSWLASDTSLTFNSLAQGASDVGITYHAYAEMVAAQQGVIDRVEYAWRDHFVLVGPKNNPARLPTDGQASIYALFALLFQAAVETASSPNPVRFLSRYDKSANNIAESRIWATIGQTPWSNPYSPFYHRYVEFPFGALRAASKLGEYTLIDRGTWTSIDRETKDRMVLFKDAFDAAEDDPLLNPAHVLVGTYSQDTSLANDFVKWMIDAQGGQEIVGNFEVDGKILYSPAPQGVDPMNRVNLLQ